MTGKVISAGQETARRAEALARELHAGQTYHGTELDFVNYHLVPGVRTVRELGGDTTDEAILWLHDVVEDTEATLDDLSEQGFSADIVTAVDCLTVTPPESHEDNLQRVIANQRAYRLKPVDGSRNLVSTLELKDGMSPEDYEACLRMYAGKLITLALYLPDKPDVTGLWQAYIRGRAAFAEEVLRDHRLL